MTREGRTGVDEDAYFPVWSYGYCVGKFRKRPKPKCPDEYYGDLADGLCMKCWDKWTSQRESLHKKL